MVGANWRILAAPELRSIVRTEMRPLRISRIVMHRFLAVGLGAVLLGASPLHAQQRDTTVVIGPHYEAGSFHRWMFGNGYRPLWTSPVRAPILDLQTFGGGLTPTTACPGSSFCPGRQTLQIRFEGADGREYAFRGIDKVQDILGDEFTGTVVQDIAQDQTSSAQPMGPAIAAPLMEAAGILHTDPQLVVLPNDASLGEHRDVFGGAVGFVEARAVVETGRTPFAGAAEIIDGEALFAKLRESNRHRVDTRAFLTARLFDMFIGDWDRHRGQWTWARFGNASTTRWIPIPEDRDQAFVRYDGFALSIARWSSPQLVNFNEKQPSVIGVNWNGREVDRHFLPDLGRAVWDSIATYLQGVWTDEVIEAAVQAIPPELFATSGQDIATTLKARRDWLVEFADRYYQVITKKPDVHASDDPEHVTITRHVDGSTTIALARADGTVFYDRRFVTDETDEIRVYLYGGADRVVVEGEGAATIQIRIIAGDGNDAIDNQSGAGGIRVYDAEGASTVTGPQIDMDRKPYTPPPRLPGNSPPHRDWGRLWQFLGWGSYSPDLGLFIGGGANRTSYGFRHFPFANKIRMRGGWAFKHKRGNLDIQTVWYQPNARRSYQLQTKVSGVEITRFGGLGNDRERPGSNKLYAVNQVQLRIAPEVVLPLSSSSQLVAGVDITYSNTRDTPGTLLTDSLSGIYGDDQFGKVGASARLMYDSRNVSANPTKGLYFEIGGNVRPKIWDVDSTAYGAVHGTASTYLTAFNVPLRPTLAVRAGGHVVFGTFPFMDAAFIGDTRTVRLGRENRYGGDAAAWGNAELRLRLGRLFIVLPEDIGVFGLVDVGRVWLDGEVSKTWHSAYGGGLWIAPLSEASTISVAVAQSEERLALYIQAGFAF